jgi:MFS family permease
MKRPGYIIPVIVISQFAGTSLWFAGNVVAKQGLSFVQFGFIAGTFLFALLSLADRYSPSRVFFVSSLLAALSNLLLLYSASDPLIIKSARLLTGFFLAGIYPVGMKIASDWFREGLGKALGWLVGALVLGTSLPYFLQALSLSYSNDLVIWFTSAFAVIGGLCILIFVKDGPFRIVNKTFSPKKAIQVFRLRDFRAAAFGYFGHMWELYAFWAFLPYLIELNGNGNVPLWSFITIAAGSLGCVIGGFMAQSSGSAKVAFTALAISAACCMLSLFVNNMPEILFYAFMITWGITVVADSPQFSSLVANTAPAEWKGSAITLVTCIGFAITIASIELLRVVLKEYNGFYLLVFGPLIGLIYLWKLVKKTRIIDAG